jgi:hypothetical protein
MINFSNGNDLLSFSIFQSFNQMEWFVNFIIEYLQTDQFQFLTKAIA